MGRVAISTIVDAFLVAYESHVPFREDRLLGRGLADEARPVLEALVESLELGVPLAQAHEATALVSLLGRRAGLLGATPTAALAIVRALARGARAGGCVVTSELEERLIMVGFEGYCAGRDERLWRESAGMLRASQAQVLLAPRCTAAFLAGRHESEALTVLMEDIGRHALNHDALACLLDVSRLTLLAEDEERALFHGLGTLCSLGTTPLLVASAALAAVTARFAVHAPALRVFDSFGEAFTAALAEAGFELKARRRWPALLFTRARSGTR